MRSAAGGRRKALLAAVAVVAVLLGAALVYLVVQLEQRADTVAARSEATHSATTAVEALLSYDSAKLGDVQRTIDDATTGGFRDEFDRLFNGTVRPNALKMGARTTAKVVASAWVSAEPGRVVTLLFINQSTSTAQTVGDRIDTVQARVTMVDVGGRWLVAGLDQV